jgi:hypothetical protein
MALYDNLDDSLDRSSHLTGDHDDYNSYALDWPENVFGEELPTNKSTFYEELDPAAEEETTDDEDDADIDEDDDEDDDELADDDANPEEESDQVA